MNLSEVRAAIENHGGREILVDYIYFEEKPLRETRWFLLADDTALRCTVKFVGESTDAISEDSWSLIDLRAGGQGEGPPSVDDVFLGPSDYRWEKVDAMNLER